ncbi:glutathione S-transferase C-terminal-like protein [Coniophora puteana RWD-64-598 SS2]|uniref:Glutathione S-transferase C-terminal-like protein n=1 Tax=Coniophora puteana (strain RWD-64-598) TaxID=741705 RepID=A0A5M3N2W6_CONPW|nr:glutathione S-transferase C-terminal-like protein [Coniophora puteana RWD-64-598 SS2]EIW85732.1 glutathione S-transferase C-terminal-like protein [Coniophora puteana RWD-64-598 SS2]
MTANITLYFLQTSRAIRTAWLLEELGVPYNIEFSSRVNMKAPPEFIERSGNPLGRFPSIKDGDLCLYESGAIAEYLCEKYDTTHRLYPAQQPLRSRAQIWLHAAEATFLLHSMAIFYARGNFPPALKETNPDALAQMVKGMSVNVQRDLDWLEAELAKSSGPFILGAQVTIADTMMEFSIDMIMLYRLGIDGGGPWPRIEAWLQACHASDTYKRAVEKTGYSPSFSTPAPPSDGKHASML